MAIDITVVIPLYNEEESLPELKDRLTTVLDQTGRTYQVLLIDDGSNDNSWQVIEECHQSDSRFKGIRLNRNYGKSAALDVGFKNAEGEVVITMDADLQDSPEEIPELVRMITEDNYDLVSGWKKKRRDPISKTIPSRFFNYVTRIISGIKLHDFNCGLKAYKKEVVKNISVYGEMHRYIPFIAKWHGYNRIGEKVVEHNPRKYGKTKFGLERFINGFLDLLSITFVAKFKKRPMHFFGTWGILTIAIGAIITVWVIGEKIYKIHNQLPVRDVVDQPLFFLALVALIIGTQLFLAGFLGELVSQSQPRSTDYIVRESVLASRMIKYSIIIPVFNRPDEIRELLESLSSQHFTDFEVIVVEDGSTKPAKEVVLSFADILDISYLFKENSGPGLSRNFGADSARGEVLVFLDSDCLVPDEYLQNLDDYLSKNQIDAFGGPDRAHPTFSVVQKAINYAMTSFLSTGGIRGGKKQLEKFHPRSFNMGVNKDAFVQCSGFSNMRFGEDIDLSIRLIKNGYRAALIPAAYVFHKRRTRLLQFYKQVYNSGIARVHLSLIHPGSLKLVHTFPTLFSIATTAMILLIPFNKMAVLPVVLYFSSVIIHSTILNRNLLVGLLSVPSVFIQLFGYGLGFMVSLIRLKLLKKDPSFAFSKNFYN